MGRISQQVSGSALTATHASQGCDAWRSARQRPQADLNEVAYGHGCRGRVMLWSSGSPSQRGVRLAETIDFPASYSLQRDSIVAP